MKTAPVDDASGVVASSEATDVAPEVSVVVVTLDRCQDLVRALASIECQRLSSGSFEIIVVDDGSTDGTWEMLRQNWIPSRSEGCVRRLALRNPRRLRPGNARNRGARHASGRLLVFMDSDCVAEAGWLDELVAPFRDDSVGAVGGCEIDDPCKPRVARAVHFALTSPITSGRVRGGSGARAGRYRPRSFSMAVRRDLFEQVGGFPDMFYGEDIDLALRIEQLGFQMRFAARSRVHHARRQTLASVWTQAYSMGRARMRLIRINRGHLEPIYVAPAIGVAGALATLLAAGAWTPARLLLAAGLLGTLGYAVLVASAAAAAVRDPAVALLAPVVFVLQQVAYGCGFLAALLERAPSSARAELRG